MLQDKYKVLILSSNIPLESFERVRIDGTLYEPQIVYDASNEIGIISNDSFAGKIIEFV